MTIRLRKTTVSREYLKKMINEGGNAWFSLFDSKRKLVKAEGDARIFGLGVRIQPSKNKEGYFDIVLLDGQGYDPFTKKKGDSETQVESGEEIIG